MVTEVSSLRRSLRKNTYPNVVGLYARASVDRRTRSKRNGRCLAGLSFEETIEFEALEALPPFDDNGNVGWIFEGKPTAPREKRWLELYQKHQRALMARC